MDRWIIVCKAANSSKIEWQRASGKRQQAKAKAKSKGNDRKWLAKHPLSWGLCPVCSCTFQQPFHCRHVDKQAVMQKLQCQSSVGGMTLLQEEEDENVEENEEYQEGKLRFAGGRKEEATYDAGDEEDKQIAADVRHEAERRGGEGEVGYLVCLPSVGFQLSWGKLGCQPNC